MHLHVTLRNVLLLYTKHVYFIENHNLMDPNIAVAVSPSLTSVPTRRTLSSAWSIVKKAYAFYKEHFKKLWPLFLLGALGNIGLRLSNVTNSLKGAEDVTISAPVIVLLLIVSIVCVLFLFLSKIALFKSIADIRSGQFIGIKDSYRQAKSLFWPVIFISVTSQLAIVGASLLLIVPGIILSGYLTFSQYELYVEGKRGIQALLGSWNLIKGYWWSVVFKVIATGLIVGLFTAAIFTILAVPAIVIGVALKGSVAGIITYVVAGTFFALVFFLFLAPLSILVIFEIYYDLRAVKAGNIGVDVALDASRKKKITALAIFGIVGLVTAFSVGFYFGFKEAATSHFSDLQQIVIPRDTHFTAESASDLFTIDYPANWHKAGEMVISNPDTYMHQVSFVPNDKLQASSTVVSLGVSRLPNGVSDLESFQGFIISAVRDYPDRKVSSIKTATTTISIYPTLELSYDMEDTATSTLTSGTHRKVFQKVFLRGDFYYLISYEAEPEYFSENLDTVNKMIDSLYLYYTHAKVGEFNRYVNRDYGFEVNYPVDWIDVWSSPDEGGVAQFVEPLLDADGYVVGGKGVRVHVNRYEKELESFVGRFVQLAQKGTKSLVVDQNIPVKLSGYDATRLSLSFQNIDDTATSTLTSFFVLDKGKVYTLSFPDFELDEALMQKIVDSFVITGGASKSEEVEMQNLAMYENRQFGHTITVPKEWYRISEIDIPSGIAESYMPLKDSNDSFTGVLSLGVIDTEIYPRSYPVVDYRDDGVISWKQWYGESKGFKVEDTGTATIDGNPAAYFVGTYKGEFGPNGELPPTLKVKQVFIDKDNMKRWISYIDDEVDFEKNVLIFDRAVKSFTWR